MRRYIGILVVLFAVFVVINSLYEQIQKDNKSAKSTRILCHENVTVFERIYNDKKVESAQKNLLVGNYILSSSVQKATYSKSKLFDYVNLTDMDKIAVEMIESYVKNRELSDDKLKISYYIYENDIKDPGKKTEKSKLYAGYVVFRFSDDKDELIYQVQIDFMDKKGIDLPQSIKCAIKSFITI
ncbi:MAG TPA: hypothetical protein EYG93_10695 [Sulfurospirillum arcachonense]|nr:hypothetical protein [Sulfurospirillum arcachonense]HIP45768.1 hypothetical protein [Sulfurospirillum arcachonense]